MYSNLNSTEDRLDALLNYREKKITKVVKSFIRRGANTFGNIVYVCSFVKAHSEHSQSVCVCVYMCVCVCVCVCVCLCLCVLGCGNSM